MSERDPKPPAGYTVIDQHYRTFEDLTLSDAIHNSPCEIDVTIPTATYGRRQAFRFHCKTHNSTRLSYTFTPAENLVCDKVRGI